MYFYSQMRWDLKGMNFEELWKMEGDEARAAVKSIEDGIVNHLYKVNAEQYVISIGDTPSIDDFDRYTMGILPMREHLIFEEVLPLEEGFSINVFNYLKENTETTHFLHYVKMSWKPKKRIVDELWTKAVEELKAYEAAKVLGLYRVAGKQEVIAIVDVKDAASITALTNLPVLQSPVVEKVWSLRGYLSFAEDVWKGYKFS